MRPPVIDGIEEHDPAGRIEQLAQDSDLARALRIEELDFLESSLHNSELAVSSRSRVACLVPTPKVACKGSARP